MTPGHKRRVRELLTRHGIAPDVVAAVVADLADVARAAEARAYAHAAQVAEESAPSLADRLRGMVQR